MVATTFAFPVARLQEHAKIMSFQRGQNNRQASSHRHILALEWGRFLPLPKLGKFSEEAIRENKCKHPPRAGHMSMLACPQATGFRWERVRSHIALQHSFHSRTLGSRQQPVC